MNNCLSVSSSLPARLRKGRGDLHTPGAGTAMGKSQAAHQTLGRHALLLLNQATSRGVSGTTFLALLWFHTPWMVWFVAGALLNSGLGKLLKYTLRQERPSGATLKTPGMPSSHAVALTYFAVALSLAARGRHNTGLVCCFCASYAILVCYTRVAITKVHTLPQVAVGALLGATNAILWDQAVLSHCSSHSVPLGEFFRPSAWLCGGGAALRGSL